MIAAIALAQLALAVAKGPAPGQAPGQASSPHAGGRAPASASAPPTNVEADQIEYQYKQNRTVMTGKPLVTFTREDATLVCRRMVADHDPSGDIRHAVCTGDVKLTRGEKSVACQRGIYDAPTNKITCRGDPVLRDGASVMYGEEVIYDLEQDKVFVKRGKGTLIQKPGQKLPGPKGKQQQ